MPNILGRDVSFKRMIGKTKTRSQMLLMKTNDGRLVEREVPVMCGCAIDEDLCGGFLIDETNQYQDERTGYWYQLIDEKSTIPICLLNKYRVEVKPTDKKDKINKNPMEELISGIFHHSWTTILATLDREAEQDRQKSWLYLILGIPVILCALVISMMMF